MKMLKVAIDLGRSHIRVDIGEDKDVKIVDSKYMEIPVTDMNRKDSDDLLDDFVIESCPVKEISARRYARGAISDYHKGTFTQADNQLKKFDQLETFVNITHVLATSLIENGMQKFNEEIKLGICVPCGEFFTEGANIMRDRLVGTYTVFFPLTADRVVFRLDRERIVITPEGTIALSALSKDERQQKLGNRNIIIGDAGYGSFDVSIMSNKRPIGNTARSFPIGGVTLDAMVESELEKNSYFASVTNVKNAVERGYIEFGNSTVDVGEIVFGCKQRLADEFVKRMQKVVIDSMLSDSEINGFTPVGRCFNPSAAGPDSPRFTGNMVEMVLSNWRYAIDVVDLRDTKYGYEVANVRGVRKAI